MTGIELLTDWIARVSQRRYMTNEWLFADDMKVYVRKGYHLGLICLDVATVEVYEQGRGTFTRFLEATHQLNPWDATFCESVLEERLCRFLERRGFLRTGVEPNYMLQKGCS